METSGTAPMSVNSTLIPLIVSWLGKYKPELHYRKYIYSSPLQPIHYSLFTTKRGLLWKEEVPVCKIHDVLTHKCNA